MRAPARRLAYRGHVVELAGFEFGAFQLAPRDFVRAIILADLARRVIRKQEAGCFARDCIGTPARQDVAEGDALVTGPGLDRDYTVEAGDFAVRHDQGVVGVGRAAGLCRYERKRLPSAALTDF